MNIGELISIKTLGDEEDFTEKHTPYRAEVRMFSCVQLGDIEKLMAELQSIESSIITGKLSNDGIMQYKYLAVSTVTLATRYAIQGGLDESTAYEFSDRVIMSVDTMKTKADILNFTAGQIIRLTDMVRESKERIKKSPYVRKCICYINENMGKKITVAGLSELCGISPDYLSQVFKEEMGENLSSYITRKKLEKAKNLLSENKSSREVCSLLGFSSQSHFITAFKKHYHMTPTEYFKMVK
ncbi:MAG: helix-turn-helix domain-containing protein [Clostridia bacterium]|nr:helix-turn-helix domain-containing protein [Clostridia bacterium]